MARLTFQFTHGLQMCKDGVTKKVVSFSPRDSFRPSFHKFCKDGLAFVSIYTAGGGRFQLVVQNLSSQVGDIEKSICLFQKKRKSIWALTAEFVKYRNQVSTSHVLTLRS
jgi:hypothetical protein